MGLPLQSGANMAEPAAGRGRGGAARAAPPARGGGSFRGLPGRIPRPRDGQNSKTPFRLLVAVVRSAQATDAGVNKATPALFTVADTPEKMAALGEDKLTDYIKTIGLYG